MIREEMSEIKKENMYIMRDMKLFHHYFFNFWKERSRDALLERTYLLENIVESPQNLYNICEGVGYVEVEHYNGKTHHYIGFRQPVPFLYHTGASRNDEILMQSSSTSSTSTTKRLLSASRLSSSLGGPYGSSMPSHHQLLHQDDWFEVFLSGKGYPHHLANISMKSVKQIVIAANGQVQQRACETMMNSSVVLGID